MSFLWEAHASFFSRSLLRPGLPRMYVVSDAQRMTLAHFCIQGLDLMGKLDYLSEEDKMAVRAWIHAQEVHAPSSYPG
ncbi:unnamed protein product, partial [Discosporangium mesarthrocarpum]